MSVLKHRVLSLRTSMVAGLMLTTIAILIPGPTQVHALSPSTVTSSSIITTTVGTGTAGFSGDGGLATSARLNEPRDTAVGPDGSLYIADTYNNRIRKVSPQGVITTFAGNGNAAYGGDNGPATNASIRLPHDVTVDGNGVVYIADSNNNRVRRVGTDGIITTVAGTGTGGYNGDNRLATTARLKNPKSVALFGNALYIADGYNHRIRKVDLNTGIITTVVGAGTAGFSGDGGPATLAKLNTPQRIAFDSVGNLYITDTLNNRIRRVDYATGIITTVAGNGNGVFAGDGGLAVNASIRRPRGIALANDSTIYIADSENHRIRLLNLTTGIISTLAGSSTRNYVGDNGPASKAGFKNPRGLTVDAAGNLIIADTFHSVIRTIWSANPAP